MINKSDKYFDRTIVESHGLYKKIIYTLSGFFFLIQLIIDFSFDNIIANCLCLSTTFISVHFLVKQKNSRLDKALTSTIVLLSILGNSLFPVIGTVIEGNSLIYTLILPIEVFFHRFLFALVLIIALEFANKRNVLVRNIVFKLGTLLRARTFLNPNQIWIIGYLSVFLFLIKSLISVVELVKFIDSFNFFIWMPFILYTSFYKQYIRRFDKLMLVPYLLIMLVLSFLTNSRMALIGPIVTFVFAEAMAIVMGKLILNYTKLKRFALYAIIGFVSLGIFTDVSTAILIERANRENRSADEQIAATFSTFLDKEKLMKQRKLMSYINVTGNSKQEWQENYIENQFLSRFILIKFDDNCFMRVDSFQDVERNQLWDITIQKVFSFMPQPVLNFFSITIDKKFANAASVGDYIDVLSGRGFLGGFKVGSVLAHAFVLFSWFYIPLLVYIYMVIFSVLNGIFVKSNNNHYMMVASLPLLLCFKVFSDITVDGVTAPLSFLLRGVWQILIVYFVLQKCVSKIK